MLAVLRGLGGRLAAAGSGVVRHRRVQHELPSLAGVCRLEQPATAAILPEAAKCGDVGDLSAVVAVPKSRLTAGLPAAAGTR